MSADGGGTQFVYPTGKTPEQLYNTLKVLIDRLNQVKSQDTTDLTAINAALEETQQQIEDILETIGEGGAGLTEQQAFELSLVTAVDTMIGSVSNAVLESIRRSEETAEATIKAILAGLTNKGEIRVEQVVRKTENESFVSQLSTFEASLGNTQAAVANEIIARTNGDEAIASDVSNLTTTVNGNTSSIGTLVSSVDGIKARWGVVINLNGEVTGLVQLDGSASGSAFTVVADKLMVAYPGINGGDPVPVLTIEEIDEESVLAFNGTILANAILAGSLSAIEISAISANLGTITAGRLQNADNTSYWDLDTGDFQIG